MNLYQATKGGEFVDDTPKKSRAKYFQQRRKEKYTFYATIDKVQGEKLDKLLEERNLNKTKWLNEKIDQDSKKK